MFAIRAAQLIDGHGGAPLKDAVALVDGERIAQVGPAQTVAIDEEPFDSRISETMRMQ